MPVNTDRTITANRPDVIVNDSVNSTCKMIDMTIAWDTNIAPREIEKKSKYKDLKLEIQRMWQMKTEVIPVVVGALGTVKKGMVEYIKKASEKATVTEAQKIYMLESAQIFRNDWLEWLMLQVHGLRPAQKEHQQRLGQKIIIIIIILLFMEKRSPR